MSLLYKASEKRRLVGERVLVMCGHMDLASPRLSEACQYLDGLPSDDAIESVETIATKLGDVAKAIETVNSAYLRLIAVCEVVIANIPEERRAAAEPTLTSFELIANAQNELSKKLHQTAMVIQSCIVRTPAAASVMTNEDAEPVARQWTQAVDELTSLHRTMSALTASLGQIITKAG